MDRKLMWYLTKVWKLNNATYISSRNTALNTTIGSIKKIQHFMLFIKTKTLMFKQYGVKKVEYSTLQIGNFVNQSLENAIT